MLENKVCVCVFTFHLSKRGGFEKLIGVHFCLLLSSHLSVPGPEVSAVSALLIADKVMITD